MSEEEKKLYDVLFPNDYNPYYINYAYFAGDTKRSLSILKSKIRNTCNIEPILVNADTDDGSFFLRILQKDVDIFLNLIKPFKYNQIKVPNRYINKIKSLFEYN